MPITITLWIARNKNRNMLWINHANTPVSTRRQQIPHLSVNNKDHENENEFATKQKHPLMLDVCTSPSLRHYAWVCEFL